MFTGTITIDMSAAAIIALAGAVGSVASVLNSFIAYRTRAVVARSETVSIANGQIARRVEGQMVEMRVDQASQGVALASAVAHVHTCLEEKHDLLSAQITNDVIPALATVAEVAARPPEEKP